MCQISKKIIHQNIKKHSFLESTLARIQKAKSEELNADYAFYFLLFSHALISLFIHSAGAFPEAIFTITFGIFPYF